MIDTENIERLLTKLVASKGIIVLTNYRSDGDGSVTPTLRLKYEGPGLYHRLLKESIAQLTGMPKVKERPSDILEPAWFQAMGEVLTSWTKSLRNAQQPPAPRPKYIYDPRGFLIGGPGREDIRAVEDLLADSPVDKMDRSFDSQLTQAKAIIRNRCAIGCYVGILTLHREKVDDIAVIDA